MASSLHLADDTNPPTISSKTEVYDFLACDNNGPSLTGHGHDHDQETSDLELAPNICPSSTPPPDHGKAAWLFLAGCFLTEGLIWGIFTLTKKVSGDVNRNRDTECLEILYCSPLILGLFVQASPSPMVSSKNTIRITHLSLNTHTTLQRLVPLRR